MLHVVFKNLITNSHISKRHLSAWNIWTFSRRFSRNLTPRETKKILTNSICVLFILIWGRCNLKRSRRTVIVLPVYKISSLKITPSNSGQFSYPLPNIVSFLFRLEFRFRLRDFSFNLFPVWQPYCWRFWSAIVVHIHTSTINAPELRERNNLVKYFSGARLRRCLISSKTVEISRAKFHEIQKTNNAHAVIMTSNTYRFLLDTSFNI